MGLHAFHPLSSESLLSNPELPFAISIVFGDRDWMDGRGSRKIVKSNQYFQSGKSQLHLLKDAGHQLFMDNPEGFAEVVIGDLTGQLSRTYQPVQVFPV